MMRCLKIALTAIVFLTAVAPSFAQLSYMLSPLDFRPQLKLYADAILAATPVEIDSSLITPDVPTEIDDATEAWKHWHVVENFSFGKNRGTLTMIADLDALHPFFRDRVRLLIERCKKQGIELAVVETYRTHAKQNEYRSMGRKYTNSGGGKSKHQYGLAVDVVPVVKGVAVWDNAFLWRKVGVTGEKLGLRWGGRWKKPYDPGHFEWTGGLNSTHLSAGKLPSIPTEKYPCIEEDIEMLRNYWNQWERLQEQLLTQRNTTPKTSVN